MSVHDQILAGMKQMLKQFEAIGLTLDLPHRSSVALGVEYTAYEAGRSLSARVPFNPEFTNPLGMFQGGLVSAAMDEVLGPLSYLIAGRPAVTLEMSSTYVRPFKAKDLHIHVKAELVAQTKTVVVLKAEARTPDGKLVATAGAHALIVQEANLKKL